MNSVSESKNDVIDLLRRFHYGEPAAAANTTLPAGAVLPALLNAYRDASTIRYQYPLYLIPPDGTTLTVLAKPASEHFSDALEALAPDAGDARILKDNLPWIERYLRQKLDGPDPVDAVELFAKAAAAMQEQLDLDPGSREKLEADLDRLKGAIAAGGQFLSYGPRVSLHLMLHAIRHRHGQSREQLRQQIDKQIHGLQSLLDVEKAKSADANEPGSVKTSVGSGSRHFDAGALSGMLEHRAHGSVEMPAERRVRIERAVQELQAWQDDPVLVRFVGQLDDPWFSELPELELIASDDPCTTATEVFERDAADIARFSPRSESRRWKSTELHSGNTRFLVCQFRLAGLFKRRDATRHPGCCAGISGLSGLRRLAVVLASAGVTPARARAELGSCLR